MVTMLGTRKRGVVTNIMHGQYGPTTHSSFRRCPAATGRSHNTTNEPIFLQKQQNICVYHSRADACAGPTALRVGEVVGW